MVDAGAVTATASTAATSDAGAPERVGDTLFDQDGRRLVIEQRWDKNAPTAWEAQRTLCLPPGRYVLEQSSSPSLDIKIEMDGKLVIEQDRYPTELSLPLDISGCVNVHLRFRNVPRFESPSLRLTVRPVVTSEPCDTTSFPKDAWSECLYNGRNQEELIGPLTSHELAAPKNQKGGLNWQFDWLSLVGRRTVCFAKANYRFHSTSAESLQLFVGDKLVLDAAGLRRFPVVESNVVPLEGCLPLRAVHTYRHGLSQVTLAWAQVGSRQDHEWASERACKFECIDQTRCVDGNTLPAPEVKGRHVCVPFGRSSHLGDYCDANHQCSGSRCIRAWCHDD